MSFLRARRFLRSRIADMSKPSTSARWPVDSELEKRQIAKRAELVSSGANVDKPQQRIDYEAMPIG